jgi:hypothetical protein
MPDLYPSLSHSRSDCKYYVVFVPRRRRKVLLGRNTDRYRRDRLSLPRVLGKRCSEKCDALFWYPRTGRRYLPIALFLHRIPKRRVQNQQNLL